MAEDRKTIVVEIVDKSGGEKPQERDNSANKSLAEVLRSIAHPINSTIDALLDTIEDKEVKQQASYLVHNAMGLLQTDINYSINRYFNLTEDYLSQNAYNAIKAVTGGASSVLMSAASGAAVGGAWGAIAGATTGIIQQVQSQRQRYNSYYSQLNMTNLQTNFMQTRASLYDGSRGTEN